jgi:hypothetical protein
LAENCRKRHGATGKLLSDEQLQIISAKTKQMFEQSILTNQEIHSSMGSYDPFEDNSWVDSELTAEVNKLSNILNRHWNFLLSIISRRFQINENEKKKESH